mmetsp:Transcript_37027/g.118698  ORF Transcript_37027/g.118698 Transcript_37027/m.118698 type:complete len:302 (+) Transcript_37027:1385-2290(+)
MIRRPLAGRRRLRPQPRRQRPPTRRQRRRVRRRQRLALGRRRRGGGSNGFRFGGELLQVLSGGGGQLLKVLCGGGGELLEVLGGGGGQLLQVLLLLDVVVVDEADVGPLLMNVNVKIIVVVVSSVVVVFAFVVEVPCGGDVGDGAEVVVGVALRQGRRVDRGRGGAALVVDDADGEELLDELVRDVLGPFPRGLAARGRVPGVFPVAVLGGEARVVVVVLALGAPTPPAVDCHLGLLGGGVKPALQRRRHREHLLLQERRRLTRRQVELHAVLASLLLGRRLVRLGGGHSRRRRRLGAGCC